jgi:hypothetical protein
MSKTILKTQIKREAGKLYFCGTTEDGFLTIGETLMMRGKKKNGKK